MTWRDQSVFVTGATGFIGGRLCERLILEGVGRVRALVHDPRHAPRIARLPIELVSGDLLDPASLPKALGDATTVIHLGLGFGRGIPRGTRNLLSALSQRTIHRFVHISTTAVYGLKPRAGTDTENARTRFTGNVYCDNKIRAEREVRRGIAQGLPAVVLRPSIVYGPYSRWCTGTVDKLRQNRIALIDAGAGICNTTYVDNLIDAIFLALEEKEALGHTFTITDGELVTWGDFIRAHSTMVQREPSTLPQISSAAVLAHHQQEPGVWRSSWQASRTLIASQDFKQMLKRIPVFDRAFQRAWYWLQTLPEDRKDSLRARLVGSSTAAQHPRQHLVVPDLETWAIQTGAVHFSIAKARDVLGYTPRVPFSKGIAATEQWLHWANYI